LEVVVEARGGREAVAALNAQRADVLFLDVQMPELDGFGVLAELGADQRPPGVVFVTAYDKYAIAAFEVNAVDYLLKPYTRERFAAAVDRVRSRLSGERRDHDCIEALLAAVAARDTAPPRLAIRTRDGAQFVRIAEIDWLQADGNYTLIHIGKAALRCRQTLSTLEERLAASGFVRIHRSLIVNGDRILRVEPWSRGDYLVVLRDGTKLNSGRGYGEAVRALFA
jgi:two-component system LytT family response regulator